MITAAQEDYIERHAYVPEHIPQYVTAISQTEPYLFGDYLAYAKKGHFILVGYPLKEAFEEKRLESALEDAVQRLKPEQRLPDRPLDPPCPSTRRPSSHRPLLSPGPVIPFHFSKIEKYAKAGGKRALRREKHAF